MRGGRHELTALGFRYLLKGTNEQVWILLREYIKTAEQTSGWAGNTSTRVKLEGLCLRCDPSAVQRGWDSCRQWR
jgi:hypothetical protein